jgi:UDP-glucose 4-epimerase
MLKGEPGIYHIGNEEEVTIRHVAEEVARALARKIAIAPGALTQGSTSRRCPDTAKLRALGYAQQISLAEGVARTAHWYRDNRSLAPVKAKG